MFFCKKYDFSNFLRICHFENSSTWQWRREEAFCKIRSLQWLPLAQQPSVSGEAATEHALTNWCKFTFFCVFWNLTHLFKITQHRHGRYREHVGGWWRANGRSWSKQSGNQAQEQGFLPGPCRPQERDEWPDEVLFSLHRSGGLRHFFQTLKEGVMGTDCSGMGCAEEAMRCLLLAAETWASRKEEQADQPAQLPRKVLRRLLPLEEVQEESDAGGLTFADAGSSGAFPPLPCVGQDFQANVSVFRAGDIEGDRRRILLIGMFELQYDFFCPVLPT